MRIGHGFDVHRLVPERDLIIGGVKIPHHLGLLGHSDADVLLHVICDAVLGALGLGDIGKHFPDSDPQFSGIDSRELLRNVAKKMRLKNYDVGNVDATVVAQQPKLAPFIEQMKVNVAADLGTVAERINIKATTTEKLGFEGREQGISSHAVVILTPCNS